MKKTLLIAAGALACLSCNALAQSVTEKTGVNSALGITPKTQDFVTEAAQSDMLEIEASKLVSAKSDAKDQAFADQMIKDHTQTTTELKGLLPKVSGVTAPAGMDKAHQDKLDKLKKLDGKDFVKSYEDMQVSAHKDAVSLFERYAKGGDNADLKDWAGKTLPHLQGHLKMAQDLQKKS